MQLEKTASTRSGTARTKKQLQLQKAATENGTKDGTYVVYYCLVRFRLTNQKLCLSHSVKAFNYSLQMKNKDEQLKNMNNYITADNKNNN